MVVLFHVADTAVTVSDSQGGRSLTDEPDSLAVAPALVLPQFGVLIGSLGLRFGLHFRYIYQMDLEI